MNIPLWNDPKTGSSDAKLHLYSYRSVTLVNWLLAFIKL